ncbi:hypothetical protein [Fulvimarina endophytica]|uniref:hypothetical protein n=1 Tax=Fulvimarina endophytica TaxID=2293836 RepID=UPI0011C03C9A|nr:hypothetical protein [Fulvimarina endophytica]
MGILLAAGPAWAGCYDYTDPAALQSAPRAEICVSGACETTAIQFECGNANGATVAYQNGWRVDYAGDADPVVTAPDGKPLEDRTALVCRDIDADACRFG